MHYYAHTPNRHGRWHDLLDHLERVSDLARRFGSKFAAEGFCEKLGWLHDAGKFNPAFQRYLAACAKGGRPGKSVPHSPVGAWMARAFSPAVFPILGHHGGMPDKVHARERLQGDWSAVEDAAREALAARRAALDFEKENLGCSEPLDVEFLVRAAFSALVDADFLDTEAHFQPKAGELRGPTVDLSSYKEKLDRHLEDLAGKAHATVVNKVRGEVLSDCRLAARDPIGFYRLTVPTGGGKTLSSLAFALDHAAVHGMDRVIYSLPYTSIIDQTAAIFSDIFSRENVLEHHSAYDEKAGDEENQSEASVRRRLAAENWDFPLIVTTNVQLFESLFSNRPARARRIHNLARSVIILDEVQTLPAHLLEPITAMLSQIVRRMQSTVVLCTATQPAFECLPSPRLTKAAEIAQRRDSHFTALQRVAFKFRKEPVSQASLAAELDEQDQALCILNGRREAVGLVQLLSDQEKAFHLSTLMCPAHRRDVLDEVRRRLKKKLPCRLISTQVVEAGVDVDFPIVYRALAPLDRIVQAAGRCNREGRLEGGGTCVIFEPKEGTNLRGEYRTGTDLARTLIGKGLGSLTEPAAFREYFADLYKNVNTDARGILGLRERFCFREVAEKFRLIEEATVPVLVSYDRDRLDEMLNEVKGAGVMTRGMIRRFGRFMVSLYDRDVRRLTAADLIEEIVPGLVLWRGLYDEKVGIGDAALPDPADLVI